MLQRCRSECVLWPQPGWVNEGDTCWRYLLGVSVWWPQASFFPHFSANPPSLEKQYIFRLELTFDLHRGLAVTHPGFLGVWWRVWWLYMESPAEWIDRTFSRCSVWSLSTCLWPLGLPWLWMRQQQSVARRPRSGTHSADEPLWTWVWPLCVSTAAFLKTFLWKEMKCYCD